MQAPTRERARMEILNYVTNFCLSRIYGDGKVYGGIHGFEGGLRTMDIRVGDLVALSSAPTSKWHLSWVRDIDPSPDYPRHLLQNIHDGELCWWGNVGLSNLERSEVSAHPSWQWIDDQHAFKDRWFRACHKTRDAYIVLPTFPDFGDDGSVTVGLRTRFALGDNLPSKTFPNWRKVKVREMLEYYDEQIAARETKKKETQ